MATSMDSALALAVTAFSRSLHLVRYIFCVLPGDLLDIIGIKFFSLYR